MEFVLCQQRLPVIGGASVLRKRGILGFSSIALGSFRVKDQTLSFQSTYPSFAIIGMNQSFIGPYTICPNVKQWATRLDRKISIRS